MGCMCIEIIFQDTADFLLSFISGAAFANAYGGALAYALSHINGSIAPWEVLFIIEGIPTCLIAVVAFYFLPDSLAVTKFLTERERQIAAATVARNQEADPDRKGGFKFKEILLAFKEPKGWFHLSCGNMFADLGQL
jgi:MFS family permease